MKQEELFGKIYALETGPCQIHLSHGAFQKALGKLHIKIDQILICHFLFFKNTTARRFYYTQACKKAGVKKQFYLEFGITRWTDSVKCIAQVREQITAMKMFIKDYPSIDKSVVNGNMFQSFKRILFR